MSENRELISIIRNQQMKFFGHMRNKEIENTIVTEKIEGKRDRGKQRLAFTKRLSNWMGMDLFHHSLFCSCLKSAREFLHPSSGQKLRFYIGISLKSRITFF